MKFNQIWVFALCFGISCNALVKGIVNIVEGLTGYWANLLSTVSTIIAFPCAFISGLFLYWSVRELIGNKWHYPVLGLRINYPKDLVEVEKEG